MKDLPQTDEGPRGEPQPSNPPRQAAWPLWTKAGPSPVVGRGTKRGGRSRVERSLLKQPSCFPVPHPHPHPILYPGEIKCSWVLGCHGDCHKKFGGKNTPGHEEAICSQLWEAGCVCRGGWERGSASPEEENAVRVSQTRVGGVQEPGTFRGPHQLSEGRERRGNSSSGVEVFKALTSEPHQGSLILPTLGLLHPSSGSGAGTATPYGFLCFLFLICDSTLGQGTDWGKAQA